MAGDDLGRCLFDEFGAVSERGPVLCCEGKRDLSQRGAGSRMLGVVRFESRLHHRGLQCAAKRGRGKGGGGRCRDSELLDGKRRRDGRLPNSVGAFEDTRPPRWPVAHRECRLWTTPLPPHLSDVPCGMVIAASLASDGSAPAYIWLQPAATVAGASLVVIAAVITLRQRSTADRKDQWWKRTQWALDLLLTGDEDSVVLGLDVLEQQVRARVADREDKLLVADVLTPWVDSYQEE